MKNKMGLVRLTVFIVIASIYFLGVTIGLAGLMVNIIKWQEVIPSGIINICLAMMLLTQFVWGLIAGVVDHRRGWRAIQGESLNIVNILGLVAINCLGTTPGTIIVATLKFAQTGRFPSYTEIKG